MTPGSDNESAVNDGGPNTLTRAPLSDDPVDEPRSLPGVIAVLVGVIGAVLGLLPWLLTEMRLPYQFVWATEASANEMPFALLPLSANHLIPSVGIVVVGSALAGVLARLALRLGRPPRLRFVALGAVAVQAVVLAHAAAAINGGMEDDSRAQAYLFGLIAGVSVGILIGLAVMAGIGRGGIAGATVAITFAALALTQWLPQWTSPIGAGPVIYARDTPDIVHVAERWLPFLIAGVAVGWCGVASIKRATASVVSLLSLWIGSAVTVTFFYAVGNRLNFLYPSGIIEDLPRMFADTLTDSTRLKSMLVTVVIAVAVAIVIYAVQTVRTPRSEQ